MRYQTSFLSLFLLLAAPACQFDTAAYSYEQPQKTSAEFKRDTSFRFVYPLVAVSGGIFTKGCTNRSTSWDTDECPVPDTVRSFRMGQYEVTQAQWLAVTGSNPSAFDDCPDCPANNVSWYDVERFLKKLNALTGQHYRLPTEAEWEYAARGGAISSNHLYAGGGNLRRLGWYNENSRNQAHPVGQKSPNALGLYDMSGNVREWCADQYSAYPGCDAVRSMNLVYACRGGSWFSSWFGCRVSERMGVEPSGRYYNLGVRLAKD